MKTIKNLILIALISGFTACQQSGTEKPAKLSTSEDSTSYSYGVMIAQQLKQQAPDINPDIVGKALAEALRGEEQFDAKSAQQILMKNEMKAGEGNKIKGEEFLAKNKTKEGVITTESGLQYKIIKEGTGANPTAEDTVKVHYTGTFIDGKKFDSSLDRGEPIEFPLKGVIKGWTEGVTYCKEGGKIELYIPYNLAYGERGRSGIPPYSTLIFEIELLEIK